jgi:hypothetical protein
VIRPPVDGFYGGYSTLGYTGLLYGYIPVVTTAWHCTDFVWGHDVVVYQPSASFDPIAKARAPLDAYHLYIKYT